MASVMPSGHSQRADRPLAGALRRGGLDRRDVQARASRTAHARTSSQSWSSASIQNTGTAVTPCSRDTRSRQPDGRCGLEQREHGPAEQPGLLPGDDGDRVRLGEPSRGARWLRAARPAVPAARPRCPRLRGVAARGPVRRRWPSRHDAASAGSPAKNGCDAREVERVVHRQAPHPRQAADVHREPHGAVGRRGRLCVHEEGTLANAFAGVSRTRRRRVGGGRAACYDSRRLPRSTALTIDGSSPGSPPAAFGPFRVLHQVGAGTTGLVFRAHDPVEGRLVAIKAFRLDLTPERAAELARALEALARTRPLASLDRRADRRRASKTASPWFAQAYVPAESLDSALRQYGPPPVCRCADDRHAARRRARFRRGCRRRAWVAASARRARRAGRNAPRGSRRRGGARELWRACARAPAVQRAGAHRGPARSRARATSLRSARSRSSC